jgi:hypothetical protein
MKFLSLSNGKIDITVEARIDGDRHGHSAPRTNFARSQDVMFASCEND